MIEALEKQVIVSNSEIDNVNMAMIMALESKNMLVGTTYVIEDGSITEIHEKKKVIKADVRSTMFLYNLCSICGSECCVTCRNGDMFVPK